jgi:hypothetical protein
VNPFLGLQHNFQVDYFQNQSGSNQCWAILYFYEEPSVPVLKIKLELSQFWFHIKMELGIWEYGSGSGSENQTTSGLVL